MTASAQRAERAEYQPVDVEDRQRVRQSILRGPRPGVGERVEVGGDRTPWKQYALRLPGGAGRVHHERDPLGVRRCLRKLPGRVQLDAESPQVAQRGHLRRTNDRLGLGVGQDVIQLGATELGVQRNQLDPGLDHCDGRDDRLQSVLGPNGRAAHALKLISDGAGRCAQLRVGERALIDGHGRLGSEFTQACQVQVGSPSRGWPSGWTSSSLYQLCKTAADGECAAARSSQPTL